MAKIFVAAVCVGLMAATHAARLRHSDTLPSPEQIHFSPSTNGDFRVSWVVQAPIAQVQASGQVLQWQAPGSDSQSTPAQVWTYPHGGFTGAFCTALIPGLASDLVIQYRVGLADGSATSAWISARVPPAGDSTQTVKLLTVADFGIALSSDTQAAFQQEVVSGFNSADPVHAVLINGDVSYSDDYDRTATNNSWVWDQWSNTAQVWASRVPLLVSQGNHDVQDNSSFFLNRFIMPYPSDMSGIDQLMWTSDVGSVRIVAYSSEHTAAPGSVQYKFLDAQLAAAAAERQATGHPAWIVVSSHRPFYCSDLIEWSSRCAPGSQATEFRSWLEPLFHKHGVDASLVGHNHNSQRTYPVWNGTVEPVQDVHTFVKPNATVYFVAGQAGNREGNDPLFLGGQNYIANSLSLEFNTVYGRIHASPSNFTFEFVKANDLTVLDYVSILK